MHAGDEKEKHPRRPQKGSRSKVPRQEKGAHLTRSRNSPGTQAKGESAERSGRLHHRRAGESRREVRVSRLTKRAYSYVRFSTPEQALGDSERRQVEGAQRYAAENNLVLDESL